MTTPNNFTILSFKSKVVTGKVKHNKHLNKGLLHSEQVLWHVPNNLCKILNLVHSTYLMKICEVLPRSPLPVLSILSGWFVSGTGSLPHYEWRPVRCVLADIPGSHPDTSCSHRDGTADTCCHSTTNHVPSIGRSELVVSQGGYLWVTICMSLHYGSTRTLVHKTISDCSEVTLLIMFFFSHF